MLRQLPDAVLDLRAARPYLVPGAFLVDGARRPPLSRRAARPAAP
jgi:hypothetical protein